MHNEIRFSVTKTNEDERRLTLLAHFKRILTISFTFQRSLHFESKIYIFSMAAVIKLTGLAVLIHAAFAFVQCEFVCVYVASVASRRV